MANSRFSETLRVQSGDASSIREVNTLQDACEILIDWPHARRGPFYQSARELVEAALDDKVDMAQAEEAFAALCNHAGVLVS